MKLTVGGSSEVFVTLLQFFARCPTVLTRQLMRVIHGLRGLSSNVLKLFPRNSRLTTQIVCLLFFLSQHVQLLTTPKTSLPHRRKRRPQRPSLPTAPLHSAARAHRRLAPRAAPTRGWRLTGPQSRSCPGPRGPRRPEQILHVGRVLRATQNQNPQPIHILIRCGSSSWH